MPPARGRCCRSGALRRVLSAAGKLTLTTGDGQRTIAIYEELVRLDPVNGDAWSDLGFGYMVFGRYPAAIAAFRKSLEFAPDAVFTHELLGEAMLLSGDRNGALAEMQLEPHDIMRRVGLSFVYAALGRREESQRARRVGKEHPDFASPVAAGYARLGKADEAFEWLDRALRERDGGCSRCGPDHCFSRCARILAGSRCFDGSACRTSRSRRWTSTST
jgi:Flp pilus assembly protein TadD